MNAPAPPISTPSGHDIVQAETVIAVQDLEKSFGPVQAVRGLNLKVKRGQIYGFLGPNGAGKTTTIRMLLGLIRPSAGEFTILGADLKTERTRVLSRIGAIIESPSAYAHLTGRENLEITRQMLHAPKRNIATLLELVGLQDAADRPVRGYSLGMQGRLSLAAALLNDPELLILDEPTNGLDPAGIREVRDLIRSFPARGMTVLISSHLLGEIEQIVTHVGIIAQGQVRFEGSIEALRSRAMPQIIIETDQPERALALLRQSHPEAQLRNGRLEVATPASHAADLACKLVLEGLELHRLEPTQASLEQLFLALTDQEAH